MLVLIWLYPAIAFCVSVIMFDLARTTKKHGQKVWMLFALISLVFVTGIVLWFAYRGDLNAQKWAKEWAHR